MKFIISIYTNLVRKINIKDLRNLLFEIIETFAVSFIVIFTIYRFIASIEVVSGGSMEPNFETNERILVDKLSPRLRSYKRGDVVVLIPPNEQNKHYLKRVIAVPGDVFKIFECKVYITNSLGQFSLQEDYLWPDLCTPGGNFLKDGRSFRLGNDEYIVLGDNREKSVDSRFFGVVTTKNILGHVIFRFWPLNKVGLI